LFYELPDLGFERCFLGVMRPNAADGTGLETGAQASSRVAMSNSGQLIGGDSAFLNAVEQMIEQRRRKILSADLRHAVSRRRNRG
jgi:hypothetical protein